MRAAGSSRPSSSPSAAIAEAIAVPLLGAELEGSITVWTDKGDLFTFTPEDLRALTSMGSHAAVAIHSASCSTAWRREVEEKEYQALHDALTGLPNRSLFQPRSTRARLPGRGCAAHRAR